MVSFRPDLVARSFRLRVFPCAAARSPHPDRSHERGSVLMVALILSAVIAISLSSFLSLTRNTAKLANRSFYMDGAQNLCDLGIEHALWCMNNGSNWTGGGFALQSGASNKYVATFPSATTSYTFSAGVTGQVKVWADLSTPAIPHVVVLAIIRLVDGSTVTKESEGYMKIGSYFDNGMVGSTITFKGNIFVNSWNSDPNGDGSSIVPYSSSIAHDKGEVGATSVQVSALFTGQAQLEGQASVGSDTSAGIYLGTHASIGDYSWVNGGSTGIQTGHATYDFTASFPDVSSPTVPGGGSAYPIVISGNTSLPRSTDVPASDGKYYYTSPTIDLSGNTDTLTVTKNVIISTTSVTATGNQSGIVINPTGSLALYASGAVAVTGNGIENGTNNTSTSYANQPIKFQLYGTRSSTTASILGAQSIDIKGNGYLSGVVYAPNANVTVNGNGEILGAVVGGSVTMTGNANFHYDESLANQGVAGIWKIRKWRELANPSEQAAYAASLTF